MAAAGASVGAAAGEAAAQPTGGSTPGTEVKMPSLSPTMTEGTIVKWCKKVIFELVIRTPHKLVVWTE